MDGNEYSFIKIYISDKYRFSDVAFLVDRDDFMRDIQMYRDKIGLKETVRFRDRCQWQLQESSNKQSVPSPKSIKDSFGNTVFYVGATKSEEYAELLTQKYHRWFNFYPVVYDALICGEVRDDSFSFPAYCQVMYPEDYYHRVQAGDRAPAIAIFVSPHTTMKDIKGAFRKQFKNAVEEYNDSTKVTSPKFDITDDPYRDRWWYWRRKNSIPYTQIIRETKINYPNFVKGVSYEHLRDRIKTKVKQYRKRLQV